MPRRILLYHIFHVVRFQRFSKSLACDKILELHGKKILMANFVKIGSMYSHVVCYVNNFQDIFINNNCDF